MRSPIPLACSLLLASCVEDAHGGRLPISDATVPYDAARPESGAVVGRRDSGADGTIGPGGDDAGLDAGLVSCAVGDVLDVVSADVSQALTPVVTTSGSQWIVAWVETRATLPDVYERPIPGTGAAGTERRLTMDAYLESGLSLAPSNGDYLLAYAHDPLGSRDVATLAFDASQGLPALGAYELTSDLDDDSATALLPSALGAIVFFLRDDGTTELRRVGVTSVGAPDDAMTVVSANRTLAPPYAIDPTSGDPRLYRLLGANQIESIRLDAQGKESGSVATTTLAGFSAPTRIRATQAGATPRAVLAAGSRSGRPTAMIQRMSAAGATTGSPIELDTVRSVGAPAIAEHEGMLLAIYRTTTGVTKELRLRAYSSAGATTVDQSLVTLVGAGSSLEMIELASGSRVLVLYDDVVGTTRTLRALRVDCPF